MIFNLCTTQARRITGRASVMRSIASGVTAGDVSSRDILFPTLAVSSFYGAAAYSSPPNASDDKASSIPWERQVVHSPVGLGTAMWEPCSNDFKATALSV